PARWHRYGTHDVDSHLCTKIVRVHLHVQSGNRERYADTYPARHLQMIHTGSGDERSAIDSLLGGEIEPESSCPRCSGRLARPADPSEGRNPRIPYNAA